MTHWSANRNHRLVEMSYGSGRDHPQYAALHTDSGYFRLVNGPSSGWGTSVVLLPCLWSRGRYYQGAPVDAQWRNEGDDLVVSVTGTIAKLTVRGEVRLPPPDPEGRSASARVTMTASGTVELDNRPGEAFKPVMLSSMKLTAPDMWDARSARAGSDHIIIPPAGWMIRPPVVTDEFALIGGTSTWKKNAPTITIHLDRKLPITGMVTPDANPNDDNLAFWCAFDRVLPEWSYTITATP